VYSAGLLAPGKVPSKTEHPLDGSRAKLERAREHLESFEQGVGDYLRGKPVKVETSDKAEGELRRITWVASVTTDPPAALGLIVGDWANNTRAALDYIVYELVRKETGKTDPRWTMFPPATKQSVYPAMAKQRLEGVPSRALPVFEGLQPFHDGDDAPFHPLSILAEVSNRDKHRLVHTAAMQVAGSQARLSGTNLLEIHRVAQNPGTVEGERVIFDALIKTDGNDFRIEMDAHISVALEDHDWPPAVDLLHGITYEVDAIVEWFSPVLE
jgi:hypothetical protein